MALASSLQAGQAPVCCNLCETDTKINWKCLPCNLLMCTRCKDNVHSKFKSAAEHKIVDIKEAGLHYEEIDFSQIKCQDHEGQICFMFCKSCDQLVCTQCISKVHSGHVLIEISEGYQINVKQLKEGHTKAMVNKTELTRAEMKLDIMHKAEQRKFVDARKKIQAQNEALKKAVDLDTDKIIKELDKQWQTLQNSIVKEHSRVQPLKQNLNERIMQTEDLINSKDAWEFFCKSKKLSQFFNAIQPPNVDPTFKSMPIFIPREIIQSNLGTLQELSTDVDMSISKAYSTDISRAFFISVCTDGSLWISDYDVTQKLQLERDNLKVMSSYNTKNFRMALSPSDDLLLTNGSRLKQISRSNGQIIDTVYSVDPLRITTVYVSSDYKVMIGSRTSGPPPFPAAGRRVLTLMNKEGRHEKTYEYDRNKQPIFTYVRHITTTTIGTIYVVDQLSDESRGRIVVLEQDGDVLNTYTGHPRINSDDKPFKPLYTVTTPLDNILVTDKDTHTLHILNSLGNIILYHNTKNIGIKRPFSLSFTNSSQLYIGCTAKIGSTD